ncbi:hypothetical protein H5410_014323 [Solanum commersonii]|uniref:Uncharacterized protein n=1 Tax=Solanum commersonii TaxID=4109 RepID=A0A9J5ZQW8_SOLCO|nr:hypothetical protein H5410_014323 [Solanum commersonii]
MASALIKSRIHSVLHDGGAFKGNFSSSAHHDEAREAAKWEKVTYVRIDVRYSYNLYYL